MVIVIRTITIGMTPNNNRLVTIRNMDIRMQVGLRGSSVNSSDSFETETGIEKNGKTSKSESS